MNWMDRENARTITTEHLAPRSRDRVYQERSPEQVARMRTIARLKEIEQQKEDKQIDDYWSTL